MDIILIFMSWLILLVPGFDDSVPPTGDKVFKIETHPDIVETIQVQSDESFDFWGLDVELKQNATGILEIKIPKNLPMPASFMHSSWYHDEKPFVLADGKEIMFDVTEDSCYYQYNIPVRHQTSLEIIYPVIAAGTWKLYSPIEFDKDHPCYDVVFDEKQINPPLEQFNSGIPFNEIQCKQNLVLIQKYDGSPACVKPETVPKLVERGWTTSEIILNIPNSQLGVECGHYSINEFMNRMQNHTIDKTCHDFIIEKAVEHDKEMTEKGYHFEDGVWKKSGYPDVLANISYHYMLNSEQKK